MMNQSDFLTSIKMDLGIYGLSLPFEDENKAIMDMIRLRTLNTFSTFFPFVYTADFNIMDMVEIKNTYEEAIYELPDIFGDRKIMSIRKIDPRNRALGNGYVSPMYGESYDLMGAMMMTQANANNYSYLSPPFSFKFEQPNVIRFYNLNSMATDLRIEINLQHADNFATIPNTSWESFYELALLDVKRFLYGALKHYADLQTAYGNISLKIDEWSNAEAERKELVAQWRTVYHLEADPIIVA